VEDKQTKWTDLDTDVRQTDTVDRLRYRCKTNRQSGQQSMIIYFFEPALS